MATNRPYAYNTGTTITGSVKFGNISVGAENITDFSSQPGGIQWWMGPDESVGYTVCIPGPLNDQPTPAGPNASLQFWRSDGFTDAAMLYTINDIARWKGQSTFNNITDANNWLILSGYPTTYPRTDYEPETLLYVSGLTTPISFVQKELINTFIVNLKSGLSITNLSDAFDALYVLAGETAESSLRNLVKRQNDSSAVNSPTFIPFEGFRGNGSSSYLKSNFIPSNHAIRYTQNDASFGVYSRRNDVSTYRGKAQAWGGPTGSFSGIYTKNSNDTFYSGVNNLSSSTPVYSYNRNNGMHILSRTGSTEYYAFANLELSYLISQVSTSVSTYEFFILAQNNSGVAQLFSDDQLSLFYIGKSVNRTQAEIITSYFEVYMDSLGKGVIT